MLQTFDKPAIICQYETCSPVTWIVPVHRTETQIVRSFLIEANRMLSESLKNLESKYSDLFLT